jgi:hypothetical protein
LQEAQEMKKEILEELFKECRTPTVEYEGLTVHGVVFKKVKTSGRFKAHTSFTGRY